MCYVHLLKRPPEPLLFLGVLLCFCLRFAIVSQRYPWMLCFSKLFSDAFVCAWWKNQRAERSKSYYFSVVYLCKHHRFILQLCVYSIITTHTRTRARTQNTKWIQDLNCFDTMYSD